MKKTPQLRRLSSSIIQRKLNIVNAAKKSANRKKKEEFIKKRQLLMTIYSRMFPSRMY